MSRAAKILTFHLSNQDLQMVLFQGEGVGVRQATTILKYFTYADKRLSSGILLVYGDQFYERTNLIRSMNKKSTRK